MANKNFVVRHGLEVSGNAGIEGNLGVSGALSVKGSANTQGNLGVSGQLSVGGASYLSGAITVGTTLIVNSDTNLNGSLQVSGNSSLKGTLLVSGNTTLAGTLQVSGVTRLTRDLQVSGNTSLAGTLQVNGNTSVGAALTVTGAADLNNNLQVSGNTSLAGTLQVNSNTSVGGDLHVNGTHSVGGTLEVSSNICVGGSAQLKSNTSVGGNLTVAGAATISQRLTITGNTSTIAGTSFNAGWFRIGAAGNGIAMDPNEIYFTGEGNLGTFTGNLNLNPAGQIAAPGKTMTLQTLDAGTVQASGVLSGAQLRTTSANVTGNVTIQGATYLSGSVQAKGVLSGAQLRCASLRVTGNGTAAICGGLDVSGSIQAAGVISGTQLRCTSFNGQRGTTSAFTIGGTTYNSVLTAARLYKGSVTSTTTGFVTAFTVDGAGGLGSIIEASFEGTIGNVVVACKVSIIVNHSGDIRIVNENGNYTPLNIQVITDNNNDYAVLVQRNGGTTGNCSLATKVLVLDDSSVTFTSSHSFTGASLSVTGEASREIRRATGGNDYHLTVGGILSTGQMRCSSFRSSGTLNVQGGSYLSGTVQAKGVLSAAQLRCGSFRTTGALTVCGSADVSGSLQVAAVLSAGQGRLTSARLQRGNISAMTYGSLNGGYVSASTLRTSSFRVATRGYVCGVFQATQLRCASLRVTGGTAAICGSMDISGSLQVAGVLSGGQIRGVSSSVQRLTVSFINNTATATYDKIRVWSSNLYTIGMRSGLYHGGLNNDYAMTFTFNNSNTRGFLWRNADMTTQQGAMSLTAGQGLLTVAGGARIGFGKGDQTSPGTTGMQVCGTVACSTVDAGQTQGGSVVSGTQLRCTCLRVFKVNVLQQVDISGQIQCLGHISANGLHLGAGPLQTTGFISTFNLNASNTVSAIHFRGTSMKLNEALFVSSAKTSGNTLEVRAAGSGNHFLLYQYATHQQYGGTMHIATAHRTNTTAFQFYGAYSNNGSDTEYVLRGQGQASADGAWYGGGVDYAEYFEWKDGNPNNEPRFGQPVYLISGEKIALATSGHIPIGVVSKNPVVTGGSAWNKWEQKYLRDEWNDYIRDENGERILNPDFDPDLEYIPREDRPEWDAIGLMGKLAIQKDYITDTIRNNTGWLKMSNINDNVERWLVK